MDFGVALFLAIVVGIPVQIIIWKLRYQVFMQFFFGGFESDHRREYAPRKGDKERGRNNRPPG